MQWCIQERQPSNIDAENQSLDAGGAYKEEGKWRDEIQKNVWWCKIKDVDLRVQTWESVHFRLMYQEKLIQGSCLRRPPEANDIAGVYAVISM